MAASTNELFTFDRSKKLTVFLGGLPALSCQPVYSLGFMKRASKRQRYSQQPNSHVREEVEVKGGE